MSENASEGEPAYATYTIVDESGDPAAFEWIGVAAGPHDDRPRLYRPSTETAHKGRFDHENDRVVVVPDSGREMEAESIGQAIAFVDTWEWLSAFAREHIDPDAVTVEYGDPP